MDRLSFDPDETGMPIEATITFAAVVGEAPHQMRPTAPYGRDGASIYNRHGDRICGALGCRAPHEAQGRCVKHYRRLIAKGMI